MNKSLFKLLGDEQKMHLRSIVRKPVLELISSGTIADIKLTSLREMIPELTLVIVETQDH